MARYRDAKCKICRREGEKLFLKGDRCFSNKCAIEKRNYPPGQHGRGRRGKVSKYNIQLREKQKLRRGYGLLEKQFRNYFARAAKQEGITGTNLLQLLERRMDRISELRVVNTLCNATTSQQAAAQELAHNVDLMIVIGGRESANTRHLAEVARDEGVEMYHVESAGEIEPAWLAGRERVGVTAGASTPDEAVEAVVARLRELDEGR